MYMKSNSDGVFGKVNEQLLTEKPKFCYSDTIFRQRGK